MEEQKKVNINLPADIAEGTYSNLAIISHSDSEFVLDFIRVVPGLPEPRVKSRIIMSPEHAKRLLNALRDNIENYERTFGTIQPRQVENYYPFGFNKGGQG